MRISGSAAGAGSGMHVGQRMDSVSRNIQKQIAAAQKKMQELSSNQDMTPEEKMKRRQELQQEIMNLNQQLQQHQLQQRRQQQSKALSMEEMLGGKPKAKEGQAAGFSQAGMEAIISAGSSLKQAQVQGSVATRMENRAGVLKSEIKQDAGKGNIEAKEAELATIEQRAENATALQGNTLANANQTLQESAKAEQKESKEEGKKEGRTEKQGSKVEGKVEKQVSKADVGRNGKTESETHATALEEAQKAGSMPQATIYAHVDIYL